jgi:transcriptional regulator with XRE-family HTH domain
MEIGLQIRKKREELKLSRQKLAESLGYRSGHYIYEIETGKGNPSINVLERICEILKLEITVREID